MRIGKLVSLGLLVALVGCVQRVEQVVPTRTIGAGMVLEQFLAAANSKDVVTMGTLFGTKDGPISEKEPKSYVEQVMFLQAAILAHDDYKVESEQMVPGRSQDATQFNVGLKMRTRTVVVPFILVRAKGDRWLVEQFEATKITNTR
jgi:hypothetical protein